MKKFLFIIALSVLALPCFAQGGLHNPVFPSGYVFRGQLCANWANGMIFYAGNYCPLTGTIQTAGTYTKPLASKGNITVMNVAGTLRNWAVIGDTTAPNEHDTAVLYRSTDGGVTWSATSLVLHFGGVAATGNARVFDTTHTLTVNAGDVLTVFMTANSGDGGSGVLFNGASCIEFDAKLQ